MNDGCHLSPRKILVSVEEDILHTLQKLIANLFMSRDTLRMTSLALLIEELLELILSCLPRQDLASTMRVSKSLSQIVQPLLFGAIDLRLIGPDIHPTPSHLLCGTIKEQADLALLIEHLTVDAHTTATFTRELPIELSHLTKLQLRDCETGPGTLERFLLMTPSIEVLEFNFPRDMEPIDSGSSFLDCDELARALDFVKTSLVHLDLSLFFKTGVIDEADGRLT